MRSFYSLIFALIIFAARAVAQDISTYQLTENRKAVTFENITGSTQLIGSNKEDIASEVHGIGFEFVFMGKVYTSFSVNTNGVMRLGEEPVLNGANTYGIPGNDRIVPMAGISVNARNRTCGWLRCTDNWNVINGDLQTSASGRVHYRLSGKAPDRVLTVEWKEMTFRAGYQTAKTSFQVKLYESALGSSQNGRIDFIYDVFDLAGDYRDFSFRTGFGTGHEQGNFVAINQESRGLVTEQNYLSGPVSGNISYFRPDNGKRLMYSFRSFRKPSGTFSNFREICPAPNALTIQFDENCPNEAGMVVFRKLQNQKDDRLEFIASLPPDARSFSDGSVQPMQKYVYRLYFLGEGMYSDTFSDYEAEPVRPGRGFQAVGSGRWTNPAIWGGHMPAVTNDVEIGCAKPVFVNADGNAYVHDLTIHKGSFLTIEDGVSLHVSGNFVNNGVFNPVGSGRLILDGTESQELTNNGLGITNDRLFPSNNNRPDWNNNETGQVAEKTISVNETGFSALKSVKVDITHSFLRDLTLYLVTPNGTTFTLSRGRGQQGRNYSNVLFSETGAPLPPTVQNVDLKGEYRPEESFSSYSGPFNGTWKVIVNDGFAGNGGRFNAFELTLSKGGSNDLIMRNITIRNSSEAGVSLKSGILVQGKMALENGILHTQESAPVVFEAGASCNEGSRVSFISGPAYKKGNTNFTFPVGKSGRWAPLAVSNLKNAGNTTTLKAEYFAEKPADVSNLSEGLERVSVLEYWDLSPTAGQPTLDLTLYWKDASFSGITDLISGDLTVAHYTEGAWKSETASIVEAASTGGAIRAKNINTFSPFSFGSVNGVNPLPVELLSFSVAAVGEQNFLQWSTASELNNSHFEVERSKDGKTWQKAGIVAGKGTTNEVQEYRFSDRISYTGRYYYRLKQVDFDGRAEYSWIEQVERSPGGGNFTFYPNPATSFIHVNSPLYPASIMLMSQTGAVVWEGEINEGNEKFKLPGMAPGVYIIQLQNAAGLAYQRLVITN